MDIIRYKQTGKWGPFLNLSEALAPFSLTLDPGSRAGLELLDDAIIRDRGHRPAGMELNWQGQLVVVDAPF